MKCYMFPEGSQYRVCMEKIIHLHYIKYINIGTRYSLFLSSEKRYKILYLLKRQLSCDYHLFLTQTLVVWKSNQPQWSINKQGNRYNILRVYTFFEYYDDVLGNMSFIPESKAFFPFYTILCLCIFLQ